MFPDHDYHYEYDNRFADNDIGLAAGNADLPIRIQTLRHSTFELRI